MFIQSVASKNAMTAPLTTFVLLASGQGTNTTSLELMVD